MYSAARHKELLSHQTSIAQKVFGAVPISEMWTTRQVHAELVRTGTARDIRVTEGCVSALVRSGLVQEPMPGQFRRAAVKSEVPALKLVEPTEPKEETVKPATNKTGTSASTTGDYMHKLGDLARRATSLASQVKQLASEIEAVAIEVDDQIKVEHDNSTKLRQLQTLLKSLGD